MRKHNYPAHLASPKVEYYFGIPVMQNHKNPRIRYLLGVLDVKHYEIFFTSHARKNGPKNDYGRKLHERKQRKARFCIGASFYFGQGVRQSYFLAAQWLLLAIKYWFLQSDETKWWLEEGRIADDVYAQLAKQFPDYSPKIFEDEADKDRTKEEEFVYMRFRHNEVLNCWKEVNAATKPVKKIEPLLKLAKCSLLGDGVLRNEKEAFKLYREAAKCASSYTHSELVRCVEKDKPTPCIFYPDDSFKRKIVYDSYPSSGEVMAWLNRITQQLLSNYQCFSEREYLLALMAQKCYAECYMYGIGIKQNWKHAADILMDSACFEESRLYYLAGVVDDERGTCTHLLDMKVYKIRHWIYDSKTWEETDAENAANSQITFMEKIMKRDMYKCGRRWNHW